MQLPRLPTRATNLDIAEGRPHPCKSQQNETKTRINNSCGQSNMNKKPLSTPSLGSVEPRFPSWGITWKSTWPMGCAEWWQMVLPASGTPNLRCGWFATPLRRSTDRWRRRRASVCPHTSPFGNGDVLCEGQGEACLRLRGLAFQQLVSHRAAATVDTDHFWVHSAGKKNYSPRICVAHTVCIGNKWLSVPLGGGVPPLSDPIKDVT